MNDSTDNTNELDSYGVWVKHQPSADAEQSENLDIDDAFDLPDFPETGDTIDAINADFDIPVEETLDLPDMDESDSIDIPTDDAPAAEESFEIPTEDSAEIDTSDFELPTEDGEISLDDFGFDDSGSGGSDDFQLPTEDGEISLDDFGFDDSSSSGGGKAEEIVDEKPLDMEITFDSSADTVETVDNVQTDDEEDEEEVTEEEYVKQIEESTVEVEETHSTEISGGTEDIDLSDFGIDADAEETPITQNVEESKMKDKVVDYDLSVSDENMASAPVVNEIKESAAAADTQETTAAPTPAPAATDPNVTTVNNSLLEQIVADLSGLKEEINNLKSNLEEIKSQEQTQVSVDDEPIIPEDTNEDNGGFFDDTDGDDTIALSGNELDNIMNSAEFSEATQNENEGVSPSNIPDEDFAFTDTPVEGEPFGNEEIEESITSEEPAIDEPVTEEPVIEETATEEPAIEESEIEIPENDDGGFFDNIDGDDTIALSGNELDNIMNNVEFTEAPEQPSEEIETEPSDDIPQEIDIEPLKTDDNIDLSDDIPEEIDIEPASVEVEAETEKQTDSDFIDDDIFGSFTEGEDEFIPEEETDNFEDTDFQPDNEEALEEPNLDDIVIESEEPEDDELPDEISIPKPEDILVESSSVDFMDSVSDSTPTEEPMIEEIAEPEIEEFDEAPAMENIVEEPAITEPENETIDDFDDFMKEEPSAEESLTDGNIDYLSEEKPEETNDESFMSVDSFGGEDDDTPAEETPSPAEDTAGLTDSNLNYLSEEADFPTVDTLLSSGNEEETVSENTPATEESFEETPVEEPVVDDAALSEPIFDETSVDEPVVNEEPEAPVEEPAMEEPAIEEPEIPAPSAAPVNDSTDLKQDIKSVLLYMDQLLENLPEEKIVEFAKSEEFATYKKLFNELGLS